MSDIKIYGKLNRVTADDDGRSPIVDISQVDGGQEKLPVNTSGSSNRIWVATRLNGGKRLPIGTVKFDKVPELKASGSPIIDNIDSLTPTSTSEYASTREKEEDIYYATLARVAELYIMSGDDKSKSHAYKDYITAEVSGKSVTFYWTYPYYFKRFSAETGSGTSSTATSSGASVGVVTYKNYFKKWRAHEINASCDDALIPLYRIYLKSYYAYYINSTESDTDEPQAHIQNYATFHKRKTNGTYDSKNADNNFYYSFFNATDNEEPFGQTLSTRDDTGCILVEDAQKPFEAVNLRQLTEVVTEGDNAILSKITSTTKQAEANYQVTGSIAWNENTCTSGWYLIANYTGGPSHHSALFNVRASLGYVTLCTFIVDFHEKNGVNTSIRILNTTNRTAQPTSAGEFMINQIGVVADSDTGRVDLYVHIPDGNTHRAGSLKTTCTSLSEERKWSLRSCTAASFSTFTTEDLNYKESLGADVFDGNICKTNVTTQKLYIPYAQEVVSSLPADPDRNTIYFILGE